MEWHASPAGPVDKDAIALESLLLLYAVLAELGPKLGCHKLSNIICVQCWRLLLLCSRIHQGPQCPTCNQMLPVSMWCHTCYCATVRACSCTPSDTQDWWVCGVNRHSETHRYPAKKRDLLATGHTTNPVAPEQTLALTTANETASKHCISPPTVADVVRNKQGTHKGFKIAT